MLEIALTHRLPGFTLDAELRAPTGVTALFGRSGSGKTTLVNALAGLLRVQSGRVVLNGRVLFDSTSRIDLPPQHRRIGYVFQDARLFPHLSVRGNLGYGARFAPPGAEGPGLEEVAALLGIGPLLNRRPATLSGGEAARVAIGRALMARPAMLALDEPLAALDAPRRADILPYLERLRDAAHLPILYVSHNADEVARLATTLVLLDQGRVLRAGPVGQVMASPEAARLFGPQEAGAVLSARIAAQDPDGVTRLDSPAGPILLPQIPGATGQPLRLRIYARDVILSRSAPEGISALNTLPVTVLDLTPEPGGTVIARLSAPGGAVLLSRITRRSEAALALTSGARLFAVLKAVAVRAPD